MKVIVKKTGKVQEVSEGYARNYLLPNGLAVPATTTAVNKLSVLQQQEAATASMKEKEWVTLAKQIALVPIVVQAKANSEGILFGSLKESVILDALRTCGVAIQSSWLQIDEPIKKVGETTVTVAFPNGTKSTLNIKVNAE